MADKAATREQRLIFHGNVSFNDSSRAIPSNYFRTEVGSSRCDDQPAFSGLLDPGQCRFRA